MRARGSRLCRAEFRPREFNGRGGAAQARRYGWLPRTGPRYGPDPQQTRLRFFQLFHLTPRSTLLEVVMKSVPNVSGLTGGVMFSASLRERAAAVIALYEERGLTLVTAESCTGGLIAGLMTETPGSSKVFERGFVTYSNRS